MFRSARRIGLILSLAGTYLLQISAPVAQAVSTDCSVAGGSKCTATFSYSGSIENWTIPAGITSIDVELRGAGGGAGATAGGKGVKAVATIAVTPATTLKILVGQQGSVGGVSINSGYPGNVGGGGGGASYLVDASNNLLAAAGGGGGGQGPCCSGATYVAGNDASTSTSGTTPSSPSTSYGTGGTAGNGGTAAGSNPAGAGAGWLTDGAGSNSDQGIRFAGGGAGGIGFNVGGWGQGGNGGFGGGGGGYGGAGGGGGGYSGGGGGGGASHWGPGGGGGSYIINTATATTLTSGIQTGNGTVTITYLNAPTPTSFTAIQSSPTNSSSALFFSITFSQDVNNVSDGDFTNVGSATGCVLNVNTSSGTSFFLTVSSCSEGTVIPQITANSVFGTSTSTNGPASNTRTTTPITIDRTAPTISSLTAPTNSTYIPTDTPTFTMVFSESVTVTGTPRLTLTVGATTKYANFLSMSDSKTALFRYTVGTDGSEFDVDGIAVATAIALNGGGIADLATNALTNLNFTAPTLTSVLVAQPAAAPTIDSVTATSDQLAIYFTPGAARGSTTSTYQFTSNGGAWSNRGSGTTASPLVITGLSNGTGYTIRIRATTNGGFSESSTSITETPTTISVTGSETLILSYGQTASTGSYTATGGTNTFTWSLGSILTGITLSGSTVTAGSSTPAGTYTQTVRATDGNNQVGTKTLTVTVNKASTFIFISLPSGATSAALGGAVTIRAVVPRAGAVNFMLGGTTISGCGSAAAAATTATCSWTPGALGSVSLTATFTPTDSSNYETSTTTTLSITVVNGVSSVTLSLSGGTTTPPKGQSINIIAAVDQAGRITFMIDGKRIAGCNNKVASVGNVTCAWKPAIQKVSTITARLVPTNSVYNASTSSLSVRVVRRSALR